MSFPASVSFSLSVSMPVSVSVGVASDRLAIQSGLGSGVLLSSQQILSCNRDADQDGCKGGHVDRAWWYIWKVGFVIKDQLSISLFLYSQFSISPFLYFFFTLFIHFPIPIYLYFSIYPFPYFSRRFIRNLNCVFFIYEIDKC